MEAPAAFHSRGSFPFMLFHAQKADLGAESRTLSPSASSEREHIPALREAGGLAMGRLGNTPLRAWLRRTDGHHCQGQLLTHCSRLRAGGPDRSRDCHSVTQDGCRAEHTRAHTDRHTRTETETNAQRHTQKHKYTQTHKDRHTDAHVQRQTHADTQIHM